MSGRTDRFSACPGELTGLFSVRGMSHALVSEFYRPRSTDLYRQLCRLPGSGDGNLLESTDDVTAEAQTEFLRWALHRAAPHVVLEIGTNKGLFGYFLALVLRDVELHTLDCRPSGSPRRSKSSTGNRTHVRCFFHEGDSRVILPALELTPQFAWVDGNQRHRRGHGSDLLQCYRMKVPFVALDDTAYASGCGSRSRFDSGRPHARSALSERE